MSALAPHIPVLLDEVIHSLPITPGAEIVDGTLVRVDTAKRYWLAVRAFTRSTAIPMHLKKVRTLQAGVKVLCVFTRPVFLTWTMS